MNFFKIIFGKKDKPELMQFFWKKLKDLIKKKLAKTNKKKAYDTPPKLKQNYYFSKTKS